MCTGTERGSCHWIVGSTDNRVSSTKDWIEIWPLDLGILKIDHIYVTVAWMECVGYLSSIYTPIT